MSSEETLKSLSLDYLNLLINGQAFSDVTFTVEDRPVHAHRCVLAARSLFFRKFFSSSSSSNDYYYSNNQRGGVVIPVKSVGYEVFLLLLQFLYSGQVSIVPQKSDNSSVDLALQVLSAARSFGVDQLVLLAQKQLLTIVEKASIEDVMKILKASEKLDLPHLSQACSQLLANSSIPADLLPKTLTLETKSPPFYRRPPPFSETDNQEKIRRMRRALDCSDVELVKLMVMGEGLNLDEALAVHYAVKNCTREVVKALLELGAADVNCAAGPTGSTPLHLAAEMVCPDMVAVLLDHHADPTIRTLDGITALDILRSLTSEFLFKGAVPGLAHVEPNKLRLCLELVQSAAMVMSREESRGGTYHQIMSEPGNVSGNMSGLSLDSRMVYLNLGMDNKMNDGRDDGSGGGVGPSSSLFSSHNCP